MSRKEKSFFGSEIASLDFINSVLAQDRQAREHHNGVRLYVDTSTQSSLTASELLDQIDQEGLDPIQQLLIQILEEQASIPFTNGEQQVASAVTTHEAVSKYKNTSRGRHRLDTLRSLREGGLSAEGARSDFTGVAFADIAQCLYRPSVAEGTLISDDLTFSFFSDFMQGKQQKEHPYGVKTLLGVTVPDGMVIGVNDGKPQLLKLVEYKMAFNEDKYRDQYASYTKTFREITYKSPDAIRPDFGVDFVVPRRAYGREYPVLEGEIGAEYHYLDQIDSVSFGHEIDAILADQYRSSYPYRNRSPR